MRPKVSILINNYNYADFLGEAVDSALAQTGTPTEVIVVDDGSTDASRARIAAYGNQIRPILQANQGQAAAINAGVAASRGDVLCFLDADDWWADGKVAAVVSAFDADPGVGLVYHRLQPMLDNGTPTMKPIPRSLCRGDLAPRLAASAGWWPFPMTSAVAVRRSAWVAAGPIPDSFRISADAWIVGIVPFLARVAALPEPLGYYRIHANNWFRKADDAPMMRKRMAHWKHTVDATNRFLDVNGRTERLGLADHFPYWIASARLAGADLPERLRLTGLGLGFGGEPNFLRRARDTYVAVTSLPSRSSGATALPERSE